MPSTVQIYPQNHIPYHIQISTLIQSSQNAFSKGQIKRINELLVLIWDTDIRDFNPAAILKQYGDVLNNIEQKKFILNLMFEVFTKDRIDTRQLASQSSQEEKVGLMQNIKDMIVFTNRIISIFESNALFFKNTTIESSNLLIAVFYKIDEALDITSSTLYHNKSLPNSADFIDCYDHLITCAKKSHSIILTMKNSLPLKPEEKVLIDNLIVNTEKWALYKAKVYFSIGQDKKANQELALLDCETHIKEKTYIQILEILKNKELNASEEKIHLKKPWHL